MNVGVVVFGPVAVVAGRLTSPYAGVRYRALRPAESLGQFGWKADIIVVDRKVNPIWAQRALSGKDVVVISCPLDPDAEIVLATAARLGARTVLDICDNPFAGSRMAESYARLCRDADRVVTVSAALAAEVEAHTGRRATVIPDPVEGPRGTPRVPAQGLVRALWFGGAMNFDTLAALGPALAPAAAIRPVELTLLTADAPAVRAALGALPPGVTGRLQPWSPDAHWPVLAACDVVVLPSNEGLLKRSKSANRLTEALWAGRWVVAHPVPSFCDWSEAAAVTKDLADALLSTLTRPEELLPRIVAGQNRITVELVPPVIAARWAALFEATMSFGREHSVPPSSGTN